MTQSYAQIKSAIAKLEKEAAALREAETTKVVAQIKESIATFGLTVEHLFGRGAKALKAVAGKALGGGKAVRKGAGVPKYRHPKTGKTWTGFGKAPGWIAAARNRDKFLIDQSGVVAAPVAAPSVEKAAAPVAAVAKKTTRGTRAVATPVKKSIRAKKVASAAVAVPETKAEKPVAKKAAQKKDAPSKKAVPAKKAVAAPKAAKAAAKAPKEAAAKAIKSQAAAKSRSPRTSTNAAAPVLTSATPETAASAS